MSTTVFDLSSDKQWFFCDDVSPIQAVAYVVAESTNCVSLFFANPIAFAEKIGVKTINCSNRTYASHGDFCVKIN